MHVFVGYDAREDAAYGVCRFSIADRTSDAIAVTPMKHKPLRHGGLFDRPWTIEGATGQIIDQRDGKPCSTEFSFTRFLTPFLAWQLNLKGWVLFCDCDFLFRGDIADLFALGEADKAVMVVKHEHDPSELVKMDGVAQTRYRRKNWSSLILWNLDHPSNRILTMDDVNHKPGGWLHAFQWLRDDEIGGLPVAWNWLAGVSEPIADPLAVHFTLGTPDMPGYETQPFADEWRDAAARLHHPRPTVLERLRA